MSAHDEVAGISASKQSTISHFDSALSTTDDGAFAESNSPSLESQLVRQIHIRDSLILKELAQKAASDFDESQRSSFSSDAGNTGQSNSISDSNPIQTGPSIQDLHAEAFDLSGLEFRSRSMVRIASQRQLIQDVMLTNISEDKQDPLLRRARRLMQERDSRVKDLTNQLRTLNEIRDHVEIIRRQRAALAIENRSLAQKNTCAWQHCAQIGSDDQAMANANADPSAADSDFYNESEPLPPAGAAGAGLLREISLETRRHVKIRSIFSSLVGCPQLLLACSLFPSSIS
jgi:hypothetical protein